MLVSGRVYHTTMTTITTGPSNASSLEGVGLDRSVHALLRRGAKWERWGMEMWTMSWKTLKEIMVRCLMKHNWKRWKTVWNIWKVEKGCWKDLLWGMFGVGIVWGFHLGSIGSWRVWFLTQRSREHVHQMRILAHQMELYNSHGVWFKCFPCHQNLSLVSSWNLLEPTCAWSWKHVLFGRIHPPPKKKNGRQLMA